MAVLEDVEVHVVSSRIEKDLAEYDDPDPKAAAEGREVKKFIEAISDEEFYVRVTLKTGFNYHHADGVLLYLRIDGNAVNRYWYQPRDIRSIRRTMLVNDVSYETRYVPVKRGNDWAEVTFAFRKAETSKCRTDLSLKCLRCSIQKKDSI